MNQKYRIDTDFEMIGIWTLPNYSLSNGINGKLIFNEGRLSLEVYGDFNEIKEETDAVFNGSKLSEEEYILGFSQEGFSIILEHNHQVKEKTHSPGMSYSEYISSKCIMMHVNYAHYSYTPDSLLNELITLGFDNIECSSLKFSFKGINQWMNTSVIKRETKDKGASLSYDFSDYEKDVYITNDKNLSYSNSVTCLTTNNSIQEEFFWILKSEKDDIYTIQELQYYMNSFKNLIQLFLESPTEYTFIDFEIAIKSKFRKSITAYYIYEQPKFDNKVNINIAYSDIKDLFSVILDNWFAKKEKLEFIIDNYLNDINTNYFSDSKLLNSIKNLEIYHRNFVDKTKEMPPDNCLQEQKELLINYIKDNISNDEYQRRFIRNIEYNPELTLKDRLKELFELLDERVIDEFIKLPNKSTKKSNSSLVFSLVQTRNYLTHGDDLDKYPKSITNVVDQLNTTSALNQIIKYFIYWELRMLSGEIITKVIEGRRKFN